ncbi:SLBB domain-containing protein [Pseudaeromonas paramecii]|uniref:SLBB domain-containing protein n=2 Tax=Pseudaeromonas paramecii TaxID=2138166 RepID=A0ABP8Q595_9GAMM
MKAALFAVAFNLGLMPAQAAIPANMMAQFSQLSPAQQEAVAAQYGLDVNELRGQTGATQEQPIAPSLTPRQLQPALASQRPVLTASQAQDGAEQPLQPFGYNVFAGQPTSQTPLADIPVPDDYVVGPGDELRIQLFGKENASYKLSVNREGSIDFPKLGPISVAGLTFRQVSDTLQARVAEQFIGVEAAISFGTLRTMQIFVMGDAYQPGAYNVNALTTVTQALQIAGGIDTVGSLRKIQVKRGGQTVQEVDLYKLLIWGNSEQDIRLRPGDTVFIPAKGVEVSIEGLVKRPAIYELSGPAALSNVLGLAGGLKAEAINSVTVTRRAETGLKVFSLDLAKSADRGFTIRDGDKIELLPSTTEYSKAVALKGAVVREGAYSFQPGMRISQLIKDSRRDLKATADLDYALVVREINPQHEIEVRQFNLGRAITQPGSADDLPLQARDQVLVFSRASTNDFADASATKLAEEARQREQQLSALQVQDARVGQATSNGFGQASAMTSSQLNQAQLAGAAAQVQNQEQLVLDPQTGALVSRSELADKGTVTLNQVAKTASMIGLAADSREALLQPVLEKLKAQASRQHPVQIAEVRGEVKFPGVYPIGHSSTLADIIAAAGGMNEPAYVAELSRVQEQADGGLSMVHQRFALSDLTKASGAPLVKSKDSLSILANPDWREEATVQLFGEVKYPGTYTVRRGETIGTLLQRAGGLTDYANAKGVIFARESLRKQEADRLKYIKEQLRQEISTLALRRQTSNATYRTSPTEAVGLVDQLENTQAIGRMTINLPAILAGQKNMDLILENGDKLYVPTFQNVISVVGQVQLPSSHIFEPGLSVQEYLDKAGGTKKQADTDRIYVIKADGSVMLPDSSYWFSRRSGALEPGDTIVAPIDSDYLDSLSTWTSATQILYQLGVAWSAIK